MNMVAPDATYYAAGVIQNGVWLGHATTCAKIEWLLDQGVNVINMSMGHGGKDNVNQYTELTRWVDHIAYNHDVHFVIASGNTMNDQTEEDIEAGEKDIRGVDAPGMAYNAITVGNIYGLDEYDYKLYEESSYNHNGYSNLTYKPDLVAPGVYFDSKRAGTSYSAPLVTGVVALMCEYNPALKTKQHIVKAILAATTSKDLGRYVTMSNEFEAYGAGVIDARAALYAIRVGNYSTSTGSLVTTGSSKTYTMSVTSNDTCMRVALAYANRIEYDTDDGAHSYEETPYATIGNLNLSVYDPNGKTINFGVAWR